MDATQLAAIIAAVTVVVAALAAAIIVNLRRRRRGADHIAHILHLNTAWWNTLAERDGELLYIALGDSAAQAIGASKPHRGYVGTIATRIRKATGRSLRVVNLSVSGARLREAIAVQLPRLEKLLADGARPDFVTVALGANDIASFDEKRFTREIRQVLDAVPPHTIVGDVPSFYFGDAEKRVKRANSILHREAAQRGLVVAPVHAATRRQGAARMALNQVSVDYFHPNDRGYRVWASAFLPHIDAQLAKSTGPGPSPK
ncbi:lysophospholipase L1-like esterase [Homoserinimonas aerilata]|uniref:Lysophospholipase L1-like esterase n=1 Tax=Homoserinimonas aerilata TaxID=1162970 RepID=A0A542Y1K3_9MICO|nr:SGNH/GDSL hydrolase family protein [Homoserinimonas aerilata]TQL41954.1 lysophospholipase L1-like esterase [Homoserinimonas aerilata]